MDAKAKYLKLDIKLLDVRVGEPVRCSMSLEDNFNWLEDHSVNQESSEVSLRESWILCTHSLA